MIKNNNENINFQELIGKLTSSSQEMQKKVWNLLNGIEQEKKNELEPLLTLTDVMNFAKCSRSTVLRACDEGNLHKVQLNGFRSRVRFDRNEVAHWIEGK